MKDIEVQTLKALARATDKETDLKAVQRLARSSGYSLTITRDYLENVKKQVDSALQAVNGMLNIIGKSQALLEK